MFWNSQNQDSINFKAIYFQIASNLCHEKLTKTIKIAILYIEDERSSREAEKEKARKI